MKKIIISILALIIIVLIYITYIQYKELNRIPKCDDKVTNKLLNDILDKEFKKISIVFNKGEPVTYKIIEKRDMGIYNDKSICYAKIEADFGNDKKKDIVIGYDIDNRLEKDGLRINKINELTLYGLYNDDELEKLPGYNKIEDWINEK